MGQSGLKHRQVGYILEPESTGHSDGIRWKKTKGNGKATLVWDISNGGGRDIYRVKNAKRNRLGGGPEEVKNSIFEQCYI